MKDLEKAREPYNRRLSDCVRVLYGYRDGHAQLEVDVPLGLQVPIKLSKPEILKIKGAFDEAYAWAMKPEEQRKSASGEQERVLDPRGKVRFGFSDAHVVILVRLVAKISPWISLEITREELLEGKKAMDEVHQWAELPDHVREAQGVG